MAKSESSSYDEEYDEESEDISDFSQITLNDFLYKK